jgi:hypothetical protein
MANATRSGMALLPMQQSGQGLDPRVEHERIIVRADHLVSEGQTQRLTVRVA